MSSSAEFNILVGVMTIKAEELICRCGSAAPPVGNDSREASQGRGLPRVADQV